ncbi:MAG: alpha/beta hydrolase [Deltaproteobacteria bacterium]|nr:alpha/beta hydrolase [Deltaproteobacteria bacterium]
MHERAVHFFSGGAKLAGVLYAPDSPSGRGSGIVLCQGYTGTKEMFLPILAQAFCEAGYACLIFDYRGWGESEGPRDRLMPLEQAEDIRNALTFLALQDGVDPERLGLYGTSFGGANVVHVTAMDARVKCTVASLAIGNGRRWLRSLRSASEWQEFEALLERDRRDRVRMGSSRRMKAFDVVPPSPAIRELMEAAAQSGVFTGEEAAITLESADAITQFAPEDVVANIAPRPILFIHAGNDDLVSPDEARSLYARAGEPKQLLLLPGVTHVDFYLGDALEQVTAAAREWFQRHLPSLA